MDTVVRVGLLTLTVGLLAAGMLTLVVGPTPLAIVGAIGAAMPAGMIYALFTLERDAT